MMIRDTNIISLYGTDISKKSYLDFYVINTILTIIISFSYSYSIVPATAHTEVTMNPSVGLVGFDTASWLLTGANLLHSLSNSPPRDTRPTTPRPLQPITPMGTPGAPATIPNGKTVCTAIHSNNSYRLQLGLISNR